MSRAADLDGVLADNIAQLERKFDQVESLLAQKKKKNPRSEQLRVLEQKLALLQQRLDWLCEGRAEALASLDAAGGAASASAASSSSSSSSAAAAAAHSPSAPAAASAELKKIVLAQACVRRKLALNFYQRNLLQRNIVINELVASEQAYCDGIAKALKMFKVPLEFAASSSTPILSKETIVQLFANIDQLWSLSKDLLNKLEFITEHTPYLVGRVFSTTPLADAYAAYSRAYPTSVLLLKKMTASNTAFQQFLEQRKAAAMREKLSLESLLLMPIQRVPRYSILLNDIMRHTPPTHVDYDQLLQSISMMRAVATTMNEGIRQQQQQQLSNTKLRDIQNLFVDKLQSVPQLSNLPTSGRVIVTEAHVMLTENKVKRNCLAFLLNDCVIFGGIVTKPTPEGQKKTLQLTLEALVWIEEIKFVTDVDANSLLLQTDSKQLVFATKTANDKMDWMRELSTLRKRIQAEKQSNPAAAARQ